MFLPDVSERGEGVEGNLKEVEREEELEGNSQASGDSSVKREVTVSEDSKEGDVSKGGVSVESGDEDGDSAVNARAESSEGANENEQSIESENEHSSESENEHSSEKEKESEHSNEKEKESEQSSEKEKESEHSNEKEKESEQSIEKEKESEHSNEKEKESEQSIEKEKESEQSIEKESENSHANPETQPLEEDRDPRLSKYSKRFTFSRHKFSLDDIEDSNKTYYPADHMREGNLWAVRKTLMEREKSELETWRPSLESELKHYEDMSRYLSFEENLEKYVSRDEIDKLNSLRGREQTNYRKKLNSKIQVKSRFDTQRREKKRKQLFSQMQLVDQGPVCDGCPTETRHAFKPSAKRDTVVRKFVGNEEQFTIYNSTHCVTLHRP